MKLIFFGSNSNTSFDFLLAFAEECLKAAWLVVLQQTDVPADARVQLSASRPDIKEVYKTLTFSLNGFVLENTLILKYKCYATMWWVY